METSYSSPETVTSHNFPNAGFGRRLVGALADGILSWIVTMPLNIVFARMLASESSSSMQTDINANILSTVLVSFLLVPALEASKWRATPGKLLFNMKIETVDGQKLTFMEALLRNLAKIISALPLLLGYLAVLWDKENLSWHDKLSKTRVRHYPDADEARQIRLEQSR